MSDLAFLSMILGTSAAAGVLGALLGLGGGILLVPLLTLFFGVSLPYAMGASILSVIATSSGAAVSHDQAPGRAVAYHAIHVRRGVAVMFGAGVLSGLLGIGSGAFKVLAMDTFMRLPMKVSTATSNFMIGLTAAASAGVYFGRGDIHPVIATPVALVVLLGSYVGTRLIGHLR